jgi:hypothetical protein
VFHVSQGFIEMTTLGNAEYRHEKGKSAGRKTWEADKSHLATGEKTAQDKPFQRY